MKYPFIKSGLVLLIISLLLIDSCKKDKAPTLTTTEITNILATSATSGGTITDEGSGTVVERGICWSKAIKPTIADNKTINGGGAGTFISNMTNLDGAAIYYVRAYAKNASGIGYGMAMSFTTLGSAPLVTALPATKITATSATFNGSVNANFLPTAVTFEYGTSSTYGQSVSFAGNPLGGNLNTSVSADVIELNTETTYHYRIKAENSLGITYSDDLSFRTTTQIIDIDGNRYNSIIIGTQIWMSENLKVTHYSNNDPITNVTDNLTWSSLTTGAYSDYNNNPDTSKTYGKLYNFYAAADPRHLCPEGWHVPNDVEWTVLSDYLEGESIAGGKMKETGFVHWTSPNAGATNSSGFTALAAGQRKTDGTFSDFGIAGLWWSSTPYNYLKPYYRSSGYNNVILFRGFGTLNNVGMSIRCLKN